MENNPNIHKLSEETLNKVSGGRASGIYKPGRYKEEAIQFFRQCVGDEIYRITVKREQNGKHHYVAARVFLSQADWEKFCYIEQYGTLDGF